MLQPVSVSLQHVAVELGVLHQRPAIAVVSVPFLWYSISAGWQGKLGWSGHVEVLAWDKAPTPCLDDQFTARATFTACSAGHLQTAILSYTGSGESLDFYSTCLLARTGL